MNQAINALGALVLAIGLIFLNLFMMVKVYTYTIVPLGAPQIGIFQLWGICLFIGCFIRPDLEKRPTEEKVKIAVSHSLGIALAWLLAYIFFG